MNTQESASTSNGEAVTQLDFNQAMSDFRTMFPNMDVEVIEAVLRENQGVVDATIDSLLAMSTDNELEATRRTAFSLEKREAGSGASTSPPPSYNQIVDSPFSDSIIRPTSPRGLNPLAPFAKQGILGTPLRYSRGWKPALLGPLPPDFLRLERTRTPRSSQDLLPSGRLLLQRFDDNTEQRENLSGNTSSDGSSSEVRQQVLDDERFALLLQSAEFVSALRNDSDFMQTLETEQPVAGSVGIEDSQSSVESGASAGAAANLRQNDEEAVFRERLRNMGKISRRKFTQFARGFFRGRKPLIGGVSTKDRPILCEEEDDWSFADQPRSQHSSSGPDRSRFP